jgi:hypothetical protein
MGAVPEPPLPSRPDDLFELEPEEFTAARNALAKRLRSEGDQDTAAQVAALRRPPVSAWALNQIARRDPSAIEDALAASAALDAALRSSDGSARDAQSAFREAAGRLVTAALDVVTSSGRRVTTAVQMEVQATVQAAAVHPELATALRAGVLVDDETAPGFEVGTTEWTPQARRPAAGKATPKKAAPKKGAPKNAGAKKAPAKKPALAVVPAAPTTTDAEVEAAAARAAAMAEEIAAKRRELTAAIRELRREVDRSRKRADRLDESARAAEATAAARRDEADRARADHVGALDRLREAELEASRLEG